MRAPSSPTIRRATPSDAPAIASLYQELFPDPSIRVFPGHIQSLADSSHTFLLIAETHGTPCGTALLNLCPDVMYGTQPFGGIENIVVTESQRGHGIGRALLTEIERLAATHDCSKLMLFSNATRESAHAFFRHCGYSSDKKLAFVKYRSHFSIP
ncbi:MAG: GNAT family N-acetyltransferase [Verrucomicrobiaceae bacterium]|nr:MAG: GNAT family N-acetyltransferase [Verrucomicrobiaceae bacterium]